MVEAAISAKGALGAVVDFKNGSIDWLDGPEADCKGQSNYCADINTLGISGYPEPEDEVSWLRTFCSLTPAASLPSTSSGTQAELPVHCVDSARDVSYFMSPVG